MTSKDEYEAAARQLQAARQYHRDQTVRVQRILDLAEAQIAAAERAVLSQEIVSGVPLYSVFESFAQHWAGERTMIKTVQGERVWHSVYSLAHATFCFHGDEPQLPGELVTAEQCADALPCEVCARVWWALGGPKHSGESPATGK